MTDSGVAVDAWLEHFAACVRERDFDAGRRLFAQDCVSFGTRGELLDGLDDLVDRQWAPVWSSTEGFVFALEGRVVLGGGLSGERITVAVRWSSTGVAADDSRFTRSGRATIVLRAHDSAPHGLQAEHTHFSVTPVAPA